MAEITSNAGWLAVAIGAVLSFLLGWLWYSPKLFGEKWATGSGVKIGAAEQMPKEAMAAQLIGLVLMAWFVNVSSMHLALLGTLAFVVLGYSGNSFSGKSTYAKLVDASYWIGALIVMLIVKHFV